MSQKTIQINSKSDLLDYLMRYTGLEGVAYRIGASLEDGDSEELCYENFYEATLLIDESEGHIKLNISKEEIFQVLENIYYSESPTGIVGI